MPGLRPQPDMGSVTFLQTPAIFSAKKQPEDKNLYTSDVLKKYTQETIREVWEAG